MSKRYHFSAFLLPFGGKLEFCKNTMDFLKQQIKNESFICPMCTKDNLDAHNCTKINRDKKKAKEQSKAG